MGGVGRSTLGNCNMHDTAGLPLSCEVPRERGWPWAYSAVRPPWDTARKHVKAPSGERHDAPLRLTRARLACTCRRRRCRVPLSPGCARVARHKHMATDSQQQTVPAPPGGGLSLSLRRLCLYLERQPLLGGKPGQVARKQLLCSLSGEIPACTLAAVLGGSGSGKTSLLNTLALRLPEVGYHTTGPSARAAVTIVPSWVLRDRS